MVFEPDPKKCSTCQGQPIWAAGSPLARITKEILDIIYIFWIIPYLVDY